MDEILDKFGIYDLVAVLLSGITISIFSILILKIIYNVPIEVNLQINETLSFLVISYFCGLLFQESSSWVQRKVIYKNDRLLKQVLKISDGSYLCLNEKEKKEIYKYVVKKMKLDKSKDNDNIIYNYCKFSILQSENKAHMDKEQSLSAMSRSLSLYFFIVYHFSLINISNQLNILKGIMPVAAAFFAILFYYRYTRFAKLRYVYIFRTFYYKVVEK